jgi:sterol desaturase/sphingolipid hydroxylase (fatty acid hydroxylase superfamily)
MSTYIIAVSIAIPIFILLIGIEAFAAYRKGVQINQSADMISSLSSGITNTTRDGMKFGLVLISYTWLVDHITIIKVEPLWFAVVIAFITEDFAGYWIHRLNHRVNIFWNRHIIHHSSEEYNLSCALRQSISNNFKFGAVFLIPAALLGIPPYLFAIISPIHLFMQFWYHTRMIDKMGWLENILVTPSHHRVHHAINPEYIDKNYSQIFIIWDKLFGTFQPEEQSVPPVYGILRPAHTWNPVIINFKHIWQLMKDSYRTKGFLDKFRIWFMPTGWRPEDMENLFPLEAIENPYSLKKYSSNNSSPKLGWVWLQFLFSGVLMFLIFYNMENFPFLIINFAGGVLFLHIMSYAFLLDNNRLAIVMEILKFIIVCVLLFLLNQDGFLTSNIIQFIIIIYLITSMGITLYFSKNKIIQQPV